MVNGTAQSIDGYFGPGGRHPHPTNEYLYYRWYRPDENGKAGDPVKFFFRYSDAEIESRKK
ncbi:hypothetical protein Fleli_0490 [Bernardetia litoralis DSM 6794]|uniref:Uncharacterized protein n=2 Tax=Bernardetia litoralis TaxID=999 RepID=I4AG81_BERLS|nr:hypothetical protein Fleli_0490 [Bernardetia litoralis DSM 6794]